ncbi:MAG: Peptidyl-tRNA hydrolase [Parcubacteria group bacterium GW2011_GWA2_50_10b]|nr:MAG: Peptidyl-tRNA hydrolase [Parcubacteria group bacterium GW2011_GWA2_50_10b]
MYIIVGLGNPGAQYARTRHNTGRMAEEYIAKNASDLPVKFVYLDTFMNKSGSGVVKAVKSKKAAEKLVVIYDDLDLPLGSMRISYNRSSGGHKGLESIIKALKTEAFIRIRIGIAPVTPSGKLKKPQGEAAVEKHILGDFKPGEMETLKKVFKRAKEATEAIVEKGVGPAMTEFN